MIFLQESLWFAAGWKTRGGFLRFMLRGGFWLPPTLNELDRCCYAQKTKSHLVTKITLKAFALLGGNYSSPLNECRAHGQRGELAARLRGSWTSGKENPTWSLPFKEVLELIFHAMYRELRNRGLFTYPALERNKS